MGVSVAEHAKFIKYKLRKREYDRVLWSAEVFMGMWRNASTVWNFGEYWS